MNGGEGIRLEHASPIDLAAAPPRRYIITSDPSGVTNSAAAVIPFRQLAVRTADRVPNELCRNVSLQPRRFETLHTKEIVSSIAYA
jgi:hypothetical protein